MRRLFGDASVLFGILVLVAVGSNALADSQGATPAAQGSSVATSLPGIMSEVLGRRTPVLAPRAELAVGRVTIAPGASIPPHEHPGTQVAAIVAGELTYTVLTGEVAVTAGDAPFGPATPTVVESILAGETRVLRPGDAVVEQPGAIHTARNAGAEPVIIVLSTLFEPGQPRTMFVSATPGP